MWSNQRFDETVDWLRSIFNVDDELMKLGKIELIIGIAKVNIEIDLYKKYPINNRSSKPYKATVFPEQLIINDRQNPTPSTWSGGYSFTKSGAYDREDVNRPFNEIRPYLVLPNDDRVIAQSRHLF